MIENSKRKSQDALCNHIRARYELIKPIATQGLFNFRCFENAVEYAITKDGMDVIEVIYIDGGVPVLHYVNRNSSKEYLETTLGHRAEFFEYYYIRKIHPSDWKYIGGEFNRAVDSWSEQFTSWFQRKVLGITRLL